jgi:hypothetical protein
VLTSVQTNVVIICISIIAFLPRIDHTITAGLQADTRFSLDGCRAGVAAFNLTRAGTTIAIFRITVITHFTRRFVQRAITTTERADTWRSRAGKTAFNLTLRGTTVPITDILVIALFTGIRRTIATNAGTDAGVTDTGIIIFRHTG